MVVRRSTASGAARLATSIRSRWSASVGATVLAAVLTAPGRPEGWPVPSPHRIRLWRRVAVAQLGLAAVLAAIYAGHRPWPEPLWLTVVALSAPLTLLGLGRPLSAWRGALLITLLCPVELLLWVPDTVARVGQLAPAAYLYLVGVGYDRRVVLGAWSTSVVVASTAGAAFGQLGLRYEAFRSGVVGDNKFFVAAILLPTIAALLGESTRSRRLARRSAAEQERRSAAERAARALLEERARIARELHDVVAHHMSVIAIHAETAPYRVPDPPAALTESFGVIRSSAVEALTELRRLLSLLRSPDGTPQTAPPPGLGQLDDLVTTARGSGLTLDVRMLGARRALPAGVDLSAFRIVQEGLSNVLRHAAGATVRLDIEYAPDALRLTVSNSRPAAPTASPAAGTPTSGHGLLGMRERVTMLGGTLVTAPSADGGFLVQAMLPLEPVRP